MIPDKIIILGLTALFLAILSIWFWNISLSNRIAELESEGKK